MCMIGAPDICDTDRCIGADRWAGADRIDGALWRAIVC
jgi:hypothetical protein